MYREYYFSFLYKKRKYFVFLYIYVCTDIEKRPHRVCCDVTVGDRTEDSIYTKQEKVQ